MSIGARIKQARIRQGLSLRKLAKRGRGQPDCHQQSTKRE